MNKKENYELVKFIDGKFELEVSVDPKVETVWLTQSEIAYLFNKDRKTITRHIQNILKELELDEKEVCSKKEHTAADGKIYHVKIYNLDMVLAIGYRVKSNRAILFRKWATNILKEHLLKGFTINENRVVVSNENYIELKNEVVNINNRLLKIEDKVLDKEYEINKLFFNGQFYDAYTLIQSLFETAKINIIIIDNYIDRSVLDRLVVKKNNVKVTIYTNINTSRLLGSDIQTFNRQYGGIDVKYTIKVHDRYIIIDQIKLYHLGHSIKDLGKKIFSISESDSILIKELLNNI